MIGRQLIEWARTPALPLRPARAHPLRACRCDVDLAVFGHTQCAEAPVPWPERPPK